MFNILVAEDDRNTRKLMEAVLKREGYNVFPAENGAIALEILDRQQIDLLVSDVMMPEIDGFELTRQLRDAGNTVPILMITAKQLPSDKRMGFIVGTDDYMTKPVDTEEMLLRIKALLRRAQVVCSRRLTIGRITLDYDRFAVICGDEEQILPPKEFQLLYLLLSYPGRIFTRLQLMDEIWGMDSESTDTTVNVHITRLRKRFENYPEFSLEAVRGIGYKAVVHE